MKQAIPTPTALLFQHTDKQNDPNMNINPIIVLGHIWQSLRLHNRKANNSTPSSCRLTRSLYIVKYLGNVECREVVSFIRQNSVTGNQTLVSRVLSEGMLSLKTVPGCQAGNYTMTERSVWTLCAVFAELPRGCALHISPVKLWKWAQRRLCFIVPCTPPTQIFSYNIIHRT